MARYAETTEAGTAEVGITVTDAWQRCGIARLLLTRLMRYARSKGTHRLVGVVLPENQPMLSLARAGGFEVHFDSAQGLFKISRELWDVKDPVTSG